MAEYFQLKSNEASGFSFNLKAVNGQTIGKSEMSSSVTAMESGIHSVVTNGISATAKGLQ
jgi:uncharacterized protein YegP (UPF0339 family)